MMRRGCGHMDGTEGGRRGRSAVPNKTRALLAGLNGRLVRRRRRTVCDARMKKRARCRYFIGPVA